MISGERQGPDGNVPLPENQVLRADPIIRAALQKAATDQWGEGQFGISLYAYPDAPQDPQATLASWNAGIVIDVSGNRRPMIQDELDPNWLELQFFSVSSIRGEDGPDRFRVGAETVVESLEEVDQKMQGIKPRIISRSYESAIGGNYNY